jgi:hypothetical protein
MLEFLCCGKQNSRQLRLLPHTHNVAASQLQAEQQPLVNQQPAGEMLSRCQLLTHQQHSKAASTSQARQNAYCLQLLLLLVATRCSALDAIAALVSQKLTCLHK